MLLTQTRPRTTFQSSHLQQQQHQHQHQHQQQLFPRRQQNPFDDLQQSATFYADSAGIEFDLDAENNPQSISSSPISTQSLLSQYSNVQASPLSTFDSIPTIAVAQGVEESALLDLPSQTTQLMLADSPASIFANTELMQADAWISNGHLTPKSLGRISHQRESSLSSSLGSAGPASPYSQNTSNPHIAVSDSMSDGFHGLPSGDEYTTNYTLVKSFPSGTTHDTFYSNYPGYTSAESGVLSTYPHMANMAKHKSERGLLPVPVQSIGSNRSRPVSVASSIASDSPATPSEEPREDGRQKHILNVVPKLDRTMTDIYNDELYNPNFTITPTSASQIPVSPASDLFAQRLQAANSQHLGVGQSPISATSRDRSPFRNGSPLAPAPVHDFPMSTSQLRFGSAQQLREQNKAAQDAQAIQQHLSRASNMQSPRTISPKDAVIEFNEPGEEMNFPLFPSGSGGFDAEQLSKAVSQAPQSFDSLPLGAPSFGNYPTSHLPAAIQIPQQYPFIAQPQQPQGISSVRTGSMATSRTGSTELGHLDSSTQASSPRRPQGTNADGGTYTCTYHGCTLRFETPALLQKHKREGHRQAHGLSGQRKTETASGMTSSLLNSQAGPHRCDRINPSTGKPCNTIFSRPYDLTRHEDTIHNARKQKVRCDLCNEEKTFSRADALTRHYRVCHPDVEFPGKHRRRGGHSV